MSWLRQVGGSLSTMTGQLSNLTKDILTEGTEESEDHETELKLAKMKIRELETAVSNHRSEIDRLQSQNSDLEIKSKAAEFQVQSLSDKYKEAIAEREREIAVLRERGEPEGGPSLNHLSYGHHIPGARQRLSSEGIDDHHDETFASEEDAFALGVSDGGIIASSGKTISKLGADHHHGNSDINDGNVREDQRRKDVVALEEEIKELRNRLRHEEESRHQELAALQDAHNQQIATFKRQQRETSERLRLSSEDGDLVRELETSRRRVAEVEKWREDLEQQMGSLSQHMHLVDKLRDALQHCSSADLELLLGDAIPLIEAKQQLADLRQTVRQLEEERDDLRQQCQHQQQQQSLLLQSSTSNSLLDVGEALSQLSDLSNISVRSRQLEEHMRHLAGQIESYEAQIETLPVVEGDASVANGIEAAPEEEEGAEVKALKAKLSAKQEAMRLLRAKKSQLRRTDRRHGRRNGGTRGPLDADETSEQLSTSSHLEAVEETENSSSNQYSILESSCMENSFRDSTTSPLPSLEDSGSVAALQSSLRDSHSRIADLEAAVQQKELQCADLQSAMDAREERLSDLQSQMSALERLLASSSPESSDSGGIVRQVHCLLQAHHQACNERVKLNQRLSGVMAERDSYSRDLLGEIESLKSENDRLIGEQMRHADEASYRLAAETEHRELLEQELEDLQRRLTELLPPVDVADTDTDRLVGDLKEVLSALQTDKEGLAAQVDSLRLELASSTEVTARNGSGDSEESDILRRELAERESTVSALDAENVQLQAAIEDLKRQLEEQRNGVEVGDVVERFQRDVAQFQAENDELRERLDEQEAVRLERDELRTRLKAAQEEARLLGSEVQSLSQRSSQLQAEVERNRQSGSGAGPNEDVDMTREAIRDLSQMVREKETEIEALKSKNNSLVEVLKASGAGTGVAVSPEVSTSTQRLVEEKEELASKVRAFLQDREALVAALNQKHAESVGYHAEIQRLMAFIQAERPKWQAAHEEATGLRRELRHAEQTLTGLRGAHNELRVAHAALQHENERIQAAAAMTAQTAEVRVDVEEDEDPRETAQLREEAEEKQRQAVTMRQQLERLTFELSENHIRLSDLADRHEAVCRQLEDARMEIAGLRQQNQMLASAATSGPAPERADNEEEPLVDATGLDSLQRERDQLVMALQSKQSEDERLRRDYQVMCDKESRLQGELQRLRQHLLQVEDTYTHDVLVAEEREKTLRDRLVAAEERLQACDSAVESANRQVVTRTADAERDVGRLRTERDTALAELSKAQRELHQQMASVNNLQLVLEQFQREKDNLVAMETEHYLKQIQQTKEDIASLRNALLEAENQLKEQTDAIEAARRITDEMYKKESRITELESLIQRKTLNMNQLQVEIERLNSNSENKIDKILMKNLLMSYFNTPSSKRQDALRVIAGLLQCSDEELHRLGLDINSSWFSSWLRPRKLSGPQSPGAQAAAADHSFTQLFVKFLERESKPMPQFSLPTDQMVAEVKQQRATVPSMPTSPPPPPPPAMTGVSAPVVPPDPGTAHALVLSQTAVPMPLLTSSPAARMDSRNALLSILNPAPGGKEEGSAS